MTLRRLHLLLAEHGKPHGWSVKPTQPAVRQANAQGVEEVGGSEGPPVIGGIGPPLVGGETQPERVLTSHGSSRKRRKKGHGKHGPNGRATSGTERPWLSAPCLAPDRLAQGRADSPTPALSDLPSGLRYGRSIGLSGMRGNSPVPFLGGGGLATGSCYPTLRSASLRLPAAAEGRAFGSLQTQVMIRCNDNSTERKRHAPTVSHRA